MHVEQLDTFLARWASGHPNVGAVIPGLPGQRTTLCTVAGVARLAITRATRAGAWVELVTDKLTLCIPASWLQGSTLLDHDGVLKFPLGTLAVVDVAPKDAKEQWLLPVVVRHDGHVDTLGDAYEAPPKSPLPRRSRLAAFVDYLSNLLV